MKLKVFLIEPGILSAEDAEDAENWYVVASAPSWLQTENNAAPDPLESGWRLEF